MVGGGLGRGTDGAEQLLQRTLELLAPRQRRAQVHPHPRRDRVRALGLEPHAGQVVDRRHTGPRSGPPRAAGVAEGLDGRDAAAFDQVAGHPLHEHPAQAATARLGRDVHRREQDGVGRDRCGREGACAREVRRRRVEDVAHRAVVHHHHAAARAPVAQHLGHPGFLLRGRFVDATTPYGVKLPEHAGAAGRVQLDEMVERHPDDLARHGAPDHERGTERTPS